MAKLLFDHFVVLMLENRSFDHLFGYLGKGEGIPAGGASNHLKPNDPHSNEIPVKEGGDYVSIGDGPSHSLKQTNEQLFGDTKPSAAVEAAVLPQWLCCVIQDGAAPMISAARRPTASCSR